MDEVDGTQRSWPFVVLGGAIALVLGGVVWVFWLSPGQPTVDTPSVGPVVTSPTDSPIGTAADASPSPTATARSMASPSTSPTNVRVTTSPSPTGPPDQVNNPIDDAIVGYPGAPLRRTASTTPRDVVRTLQQRLVDLGYAEAVDGVFGARTEAAVKAFQKDNSLPVDGVVGRATWAALFTSDGG